jgi:hypothetical protein
VQGAGHKMHCLCRVITGCWCVKSMLLLMLSLMAAIAAVRTYCCLLCRPAV